MKSQQDGDTYYFPLPRQSEEGEGDCQSSVVPLEPPSMQIEPVDVVGRHPIETSGLTNGESASPASISNSNNDEGIESIILMQEEEEEKIPSPNIEEEYPDDNINNNDNDNIMEEQRPTTPLPKGKVIPLMLLLFSETFISNSIFPYLVFMLADFHLTDDQRQLG